jgi:hypothetical protein
MASVRITSAGPEPALVSDRPGAAGHARQEAGKLAGGTVPSGRIPVRAVPDGGRLVPVPDYAPVVVVLVRRYLPGGSFGMLSRWPGAEGIPASSESGFPGSGGAQRPCHPCRYAG